MNYCVEKILKEMAEVYKGSLTMPAIPSDRNLHSLELFRITEQIGKQLNGKLKRQKYTHRIYDEVSIRKILRDMEKSRMTIMETSNYYKVSKNTISKWRKERALQVSKLSKGER